MPNAVVSNWTVAKQSDLLCHETSRQVGLLPHHLGASPLPLWIVPHSEALCNFLLLLRVELNGAQQRRALNADLMPT
jgi:hypothetical protein